MSGKEVIISIVLPKSGWNVWCRRATSNKTRIETFHNLYRRWKFPLKIDPRKIRIDTHIVDRPRSIQIVKELSEHFAKGHRKALVQMATGTGKTRVAMAIIKLLIDANMLDKYLKDQLRRQELNPARLYFSVPASAMPGIWKICSVNYSKVWVVMCRLLLQVCHGQRMKCYGSRKNPNRELPFLWECWIQGWIFRKIQTTHRQPIQCPYAKGIQRRVSMLDLALKSKVNQLWNKFWSGRLTNHLQFIEYIPYFLFTSYLESFRQGLSAIIPTHSIKTKNLILM